MQTTTPDPAQIQHIVTMLMPVMLLGGIVATALIIVPFWVIFKKAGLGGPLSLLMLIPGVGIVMLYVLAFSKWKVMPAPEFAGYPPTYPPPGYVPAAPVYPPMQAAPPVYVPPPSNEPTAL